MTELYLDWERFTSEIEIIAARIAGCEDLLEDVTQSAWLGLFRAWYDKPTATDPYLIEAARLGALKFRNTVAYDGPHDSSGRRQSDRMDSLED